MRRSLRLVILSLAVPLSLAASALAMLEVAGLWWLRGELHEFEARAQLAVHAERAMRKLDNLQRSTTLGALESQTSADLGLRVQALHAAIVSVETSAATVGEQALAAPLREGQDQLLRTIERARELSSRSQREEAQRLIEDDVALLARSRVRKPLDALARSSVGNEALLPLIRAGEHWLARAALDPGDLLEASRAAVGSERAARLLESEFDAVLRESASPEDATRRGAIVAALRLADAARPEKPQLEDVYDQVLGRYAGAREGISPEPMIASARELVFEALVPSLEATSHRALESVVAKSERIRSIAALLCIALALVICGALGVVVVAPRWLRDHLDDPLSRLASSIAAVRKGQKVPDLSDLPADYQSTVRSLQGLAGNLADSSKEVRRLANFDGITGLPNRRLFMERLSSAAVSAQLRDHPLVVLSLELKSLDDVHQAMGHKAVDSILQIVAERLGRSLRQSDVVGEMRDAEDGVQVSRFSGGEFSVILSRIRHPQDAAGVAERLLFEIEKEIELEGEAVSTSAVVGIAAYPDDGADADTLMASAYSAARLAGQSGNGPFCFFSPEMNAASIRKFQIASRLRHAIERNALTLHFQPVIDAHSEALMGAEVLLRWVDEQLGPVSPAEFVPIAEEAGLIPQIGDWVMHSTCAQVRAWKDVGFAPPRMAVNVSALQLGDAGWVQSVADALSHSGLEPEAIEIEITESAIVHDEEQAMVALAAVREMGLGISLDDFGTGYSSLSYLQRFPISRVKIDRAFVTVLDDRSAGDEPTLTSAIVAMARTLKLKTVAEGVETRQQAEILRDLGCHELQGFLYSPAITAEAFEEMMALAKPDPEA